MKSFLTADWRYLAMMNFVVEPKILEPLVPPGTELDFYNRQTFLSIVGFLFLDTRLLGLPIPFYRDFEEVNLRFYVRRKVAGEWRRGVAFVRELVPRQAIAIVARAFYGEPSAALPMRHDIVHRDGQLQVKYEWRRRKKWERIAVESTGEPQATPAGSREEFITERYWGYTALPSRMSEYRVEHPRWKLWPATSASFDADVAALYGAQFVETLAAAPASAFIAEGSHVEVRRRASEFASE
ncbi:MAG: DUF2071 domain-containing protein [Chthoniobacterales bacterium]